MTQQRFYIVFGPQGRTNPKVQFNTLEAADREAQRMAKVHPGDTFYAMEAKTGYRKQEVQEIHFCDYDPNPF